MLKSTQILVVVGPSGSGKSSLVQAGVAPRLRLMLRITRLESSDEATRHPTRLGEVPADAAEALDLRRVVDKFAAARLVTVSGTGDPTVDVAHEALIKGWPRLLAWIDGRRDDLRFRNRVSMAAAEWSGSREPDLLWRGGPLAAAQTWAAAHSGELNPLEQEFLQASLDQSTAEQRRRRRRLVAVLTALSLLAAAAIAAAIVSAERGSRAQRREREAVAQRLASQSRTARATNPALGVALAAEATRQTDVPLDDTLAALVEARVALALSPARQVGDLLGKQTSLDFAISPDGAEAVIVDVDGSIEVVDIGTRERLAGPLSVAGEVDDVDGATGAAESVPTGSPSFQEQLRTVVGARFWPGHDDVVVVGSVAGVELWNWRTGTRISLVKQKDATTTPMFDVSHDGTLLAVADGDGELSVRELTVEGLGAIWFEQQLHAPVNAVEFTRGDTMLATWTDAISGWELATGVERIHLDDIRQFTGAVLDPLSNYMFLTEVDGVTRVRSFDDVSTDVASLGSPGNLPGYGLTLSDDGRFLFNTTRSGTQIWDLQQSQFRGTAVGGDDLEASSLEASADGRLLLGMTSAGIVVWDTTPLLEPAPNQLGNEFDQLGWVGTDPDRTFAIVVSSNSLRRYELRDGRIVLPETAIVEFSDTVAAYIRMSADGTLLTTTEVTAKPDSSLFSFADDARGRTRLFHTEDLREVPIAAEMPDGGWGAPLPSSFSADGKTVFAVDGDHLAAFDTATGARQGPVKEDALAVERGVTGAEAYGELGTIRITTKDFSTDVDNSWAGPTMYLRFNASAATLLASSPLASAVDVIDVSTGAIRANIPVPEGVREVEFLDEDTIAVLTQSGIVKLHDGTTGRRIARVDLGSSATGISGAEQSDLLAIADATGRVTFLQSPLSVKRACEIAAQYTTATLVGRYVDDPDPACLLDATKSDS